MEQALLSLAVASGALIITHFLLSHPLRAATVAKLGDNGFRIFYSIVAFIFSAWMIWAYIEIGPGAPPLWNGSGLVLQLIASVLTLLASILLVGSFIGNPALPIPDTEARGYAAQGIHGIFYVTRHPMLWSFALWGAAHILVSPTPRQIIFSGVFIGLSLFGAHMQDRKKAMLMGDAWKSWQAQTSYWPKLGGLAKAGTTPWIGGIILWLVATWAHKWGIGIDVGIWN